MKFYFMINNWLLFVGFLFFQTISVGSALRCVVCNSYTDLLNCEVWDTFSYIKTCANESKTCSKSVQEVNDQVRVIRQCSGEIPIDDLKCYKRVGRKKVKMYYCHCKGDVCNAAPSRNIDYFTIKLLLLGLFILKIFI